MEYTEQNYKNAKPNDIFEFTCKNCGQIFFKTKRYLSKLGKNEVPKYCSKECLKDGRTIKKVPVICKECGKKFEIERRFYNKKIENNSEFFCCRSCAAKYNNKKYPKRKREEHIYPVCGVEKSERSKLCKNCFEKKKRIL